MSALGYKILEKIGKGSYATVYLAQHNETNEKVALKKFALDYDHSLSDDCIRELSYLKILKHPYIISLYHHFITKNHIYAVLEYISTSMDKYILNKSYTRPVIQKHLFQLLDAVSYLHAVSIAHRDLKPNNILITVEDNIKVCDFGMTRKLSGKHTPVIQTLWYRAPEVLLSDADYTVAIDIWSIGCILAEMNNATPLFRGDSEIDQLYKIFQVVGTPNNDTWSGVEQYSVWRATFPVWPKMDKIIDTDDQQLYDLLLKLLVMDPKGRITAENALQHPFLQGLEERQEHSLNLELPKHSDTNKTELTVEKRKILVDWLEEVGVKFKLKDVTVQLAIKYMDYFFSVKRCSQSRWQLVAVGCLHVATKLEEVLYPDINDYVWITDNTYSRDEVIIMEKLIVNTLDFQLNAFRQN